MDVNFRYKLEIENAEPETRGKKVVSDLFLSTQKSGTDLQKQFRYIYDTTADEAVVTFLDTEGAIVMKSNEYANKAEWDALSPAQRALGYIFGISMYEKSERLLMRAKDFLSVRNIKEMDSRPEYRVDVGTLEMKATIKEAEGDLKEGFKQLFGITRVH